MIHLVGQPPPRDAEAPLRRSILRAVKLTTSPGAAPGHRLAKVRARSRQGLTSVWQAARTRCVASAVPKPAAKRMSPIAAIPARRTVTAVARLVRPGPSVRAPGIAMPPRQPTGKRSTSTTSPLSAGPPPDRPRVRARIAGRRPPVRLHPGVARWLCCARAPSPGTALRCRRRDQPQGESDEHSREPPFHGGNVVEREWTPDGRSIGLAPGSAGLWVRYARSCVRLAVPGASLSEQATATWRVSFIPRLAVDALLVQAARGRGHRALVAGGLDECARSVKPTR